MPNQKDFYGLKTFENESYEVTAMADVSHAEEEKETSSQTPNAQGQNKTSGAHGKTDNIK